ncbi:MAG: hypothetical protein JHC85_07865 [Chthoniobacterales bacterium]|jgi:hypothetical protein|nr:hypothetical protein [Chthoniobacterales bacterium]
MNITLKDVPQDLHKRLRQIADQSGRSLNKLILYKLEQSVRPQKIDRHGLLSRIKRRRVGMSAWLEDDSLRAAMQEGRR